MYRLSFIPHGSREVVIMGDPKLDLARLSAAAVIKDLRDSGDRVATMKSGFQWNVISLGVLEILINDAVSEFSLTNQRGLMQ